METTDFALNSRCLNLTFDEKVMIFDGFSPRTQAADLMLNKKLGIKMTTQPMHKSAMAALFVKKAYDDALKKYGKFPTVEEVIKIALKTL